MQLYFLHICNQHINQLINRTRKIQNAIKLNRENIIEIWLGELRLAKIPTLTRNLFRPKIDSSTLI